MFWSFVRDNTLTKLLFCLNQYGVHRMLTSKAFIVLGFLGINKALILNIIKLVQLVIRYIGSSPGTSINPLR